jgi:hypothetical protein
MKITCSSALFQSLGAKFPNAAGRNVYCPALSLALGFGMRNLASSASAVEAATQAFFYVATARTGSASNPGTLDQPFATFTEDRDTVRTFNGARSGDIVASGSINFFEFRVYGHQSRR